MYYLLVYLTQRIGSTEWIWENGVYNGSICAWVEYCKKFENYTYRLVNAIPITKEEFEEYKNKIC
jgi:hypothetical protein